MKIPKSKHVKNIRTSKVNSPSASQTSHPHYNSSTPSKPLTSLASRGNILNKSSPSHQQHQISYTIPNPLSPLAVTIRSYIEQSKQFDLALMVDAGYAVFELQTPQVEQTYYINLQTTPSAICYAEIAYIQKKRLENNRPDILTKTFFIHSVLQNRYLDLLREKVLSKTNENFIQIH